jgi:hypothetical protein
MRWSSNILPVSVETVFHTIPDDKAALRAFASALAAVRGAAVFGAELGGIENDLYLLFVIKVQHVPTIAVRERAGDTQPG